MAARIEHTSITWRRRPPYATHVLRTHALTTHVTFSPDSQFKLSSTCTHGQHHPPRQFPLLSNLNPSWTPSPYLKSQCHPSLVLRLCIGALPAWAAQPALAAAAEASRLFLMTTNRPQCMTRAAATATSPCAASRPSSFS
jgi:hypothetical protein